MQVIEPVFGVKSSNWHHRFAKSTEQDAETMTRHDSTMVGRCRRGRLDALSRASTVPATGKRRAAAQQAAAARLARDGGAAAHADAAGLHLAAGAKRDLAAERAPLLLSCRAPRAAASALVGATHDR